MIWNIILPAPFLLGKSTHNQRIERLWRDVFEGCLDLFYQIFNFLERNGFLDVLDDVQMWSLHYVYVPILNRHLEAWKNAWIYHPLRTEGNKSPLQLWIHGLSHTMLMTSGDQVQVIGLYQILHILYRMEDVITGEK